MVAGQQPSAEGNTVGLVVELLGIDLVKMIEFALLQDLGMDRCHAVDTIAIVDVDMCHVHSLVLVNDLNFFVLIFLCHTVTQLLDDGNQLRHYFLDISQRPFLQSFCQNGVVRISTGAAYYVDSFIHSETFLCGENADQLGDNHGRMGIVDLDRYMLGQSMQIITLFLYFPQDQLGTVAYHEVFLIDTQQITCLIGIIGIQEQGQVLLNGFLIKSDALLYQTLVYGLDIK